jgi:hypothetical protein
MDRGFKAAALLAIVAGSAWLTPALAHAPLLDCYVEGDSVKCEAGFSDGTSAAGKKLSVLDATHKLIVTATLDKTGAFSFKPPKGDYQVVFDGGDNHTATIYSTEIK